MSSGPASKWLRVLGMVLLLVPALLIGWFVPELPLLFSGSTERRKPMSAEAKFLWLVLGMLLVLGLTGWLLWRKFGAP